MLVGLGHRKWRIGLLAGTLLTASVIGGAAARAGTVDVSIDQAHIMRLPKGVATIVIGNPLIADASLQRGQVLVITGKGYGSTNLVALDNDGQVVLNETVRVHAPTKDGLVVVYRGADRESYSCTPKCQPRMMLGDSVKYFTDTLRETAARGGAGQASSGSSGGGSSAR